MPEESSKNILPYSFDIQNSENKKLICIIDMPGLVYHGLKLKLPALNNKNISLEDLLKVSTAHSPLLSWELLTW